MTTQKTAPGAGFAEGFVEADGFRIRYMAAGKGDALISLHGAGGLRLSGAHDLLAETHRVIAVETPGFGDSPANERSGSLRELARTMLAAVDALGIERYSLMGNSFGAKLAAWMAVEKPHSTQALILIAPAAIRHDRPLPAPKTPEERIALFHAHPDSVYVPPPAAPEIEAKQQALVRRLIGPARDAELEGCLKELNVPTLALFGTADRVMPPDLAHRYREILPNCNIVMVYDAAHAVDADRPEAVAEVVADFVARQEKFLVTGESGVIHP